jgi:hypothetical protein
MIHKLAHLLNWNYGTPECFTIGNIIWCGFKCSKCGRIDMAAPTNF